MGVFTKITLQELNSLFPSYGFTKIIATVSGIIDTTYIVFSEQEGYILKKYERDIPDKISQDTALLKHLNDVGLNVPLCIDKKDDWYLYTKLKGAQPHNVKSYHIQALGRFLASLHRHTSHIKCDSNIKVDKEVLLALKYTKKYHFSYYKKFEFLKDFTHTDNNLIHGDIFKDNTIFDDRKIGVIDFIDSTYGSYSFDAAVALIGFDVRVHHHYLINTFLIAYNQHSSKKLNKKELLANMKTASHFYALKRVYNYKNIFEAKELLR